MSQISNMSAIVVVAVLSVLGSVLAVPAKDDRIVGGTDATIEEFPYMSNMERHYLGIFWRQACGGSLINNLYVLSAAHCYDTSTTAQWRVRLGSSRRTSGGEIFYINRIQIHDNYTRQTLRNDIALLRLSSVVSYSDTIKAGLIAGSNYHLSDGTPITAIGWGALSSRVLSPDQLQQVEFYVINQELCAERYAELKAQPGNQNTPDVEPNMMCAGILDVGGKDTCQGDSGGPVAFKDPNVGHVIVGVTSWGHFCAEPHYPGVLARVSYVSNWIVSNAV